MPFIDLSTLERATNISRYTWRNWLREGQLPSYRLGRRLCVREADFVAWVKARQQPTEADAAKPAAGGKG
jgi:excisionase family DNA binding protein